MHEVNADLVRGDISEGAQFLGDLRTVSKHSMQRMVPVYLPSTSRVSQLTWLTVLRLSRRLVPPIFNTCTAVVIVRAR